VRLRQNKQKKQPGGQMTCWFIGRVRLADAPFLIFAGAGG